MNIINLIKNFFKESIQKFKNDMAKNTLEKIKRTWGGNFIVEFIDNWKSIKGGLC